MSSFRKATAVEHSGRRTIEREEIYVGNADPLWTVSAVPHGGYVLALIVEACLHHQKSTRHPDPFHVTAHFLRATSVGPFEVRIHTIRSGRVMSNVHADLVQDEQVRVTMHAIFGSLSSSTSTTNDAIATDSHAPSTSETEKSLTLVPPHPLARVTPFEAHPATLGTSPLRSRLNFRNQLSGASLPDVRRHTAGPIETGRWYTFNDPHDHLSPSAIAFFADLFGSNLIGKAFPDLPTSWFPTVTLSIQFYTPVPRVTTTSAHSPSSDRSVGVWSSGRFVQDPQGRHDVYVEVWTAPGDVGAAVAPDGTICEGEVKEGWRQEQRCLAIAHQMALVLPMEVNTRKANKGASKL